MQPVDLGIFTMVQQPPVGQGFLIIKDSRSHSDTPHSLGLLWTSDQPNAETSTRQHTTLTTYRHPCFWCDLNSVSAREWPQTHALDRAATGIGCWFTYGERKCGTVGVHAQ